VSRNDGGSGDPWAAAGIPAAKGVSMRAASTTILALLLGGCSDYQLAGPDHEEKGGEPDAPVEDDPGLDQDDTGDDGGGQDDVPVETAEAPTYINTATTLFAWDPDGGLVEVADFWVNAGEPPRLTDIAIDPDGYIYGCSSAALWRVHAETGQAIQVADLDIHLDGLTFVSDGRLVGAGDGVWVIDPSTGAYSTLVAEDRYSTSGDIVGLPDGLLYWTVWGGYDERPLGDVGGWWGATTNPVRW
jgi:hypothetical protein